MNNIPLDTKSNNAQQQQGHFLHCKMVVKLGEKNPLQFCKFESRFHHKYEKVACFYKFSSEIYIFTL